LYRRLAEAMPEEFVPRFNQAVACAMHAGQLEGVENAVAREEAINEGARALVDAVARGYSDVHNLRREASIAVLREHASVRALLERWPEVLALRLEADLEAAARGFPAGYADTRVPELRVVVRSALGEHATAAAIDEMRRVARWAAGTVMPGAMDEAVLADYPWVVVVLPSREDFARWLVRTYGGGGAGAAGGAGGGGTSMVGGAYFHDLRRLVSIDPASTLRHEFMHVLHWRDMQARGQRHPIWIMEGLGTLVEDGDTDDAGAFRPVSSWRMNTVQRMERINALPTVEVLAGLAHTRFVGARPLANYAQARAFFLFLDARGMLGAWYAAYVAGYAADASGLEAVRATLGVEGKELEREFRAWVRAQEPVPDRLKAGMPSLGARIGAGTGAGPTVESSRRVRGVEGAGGAGGGGDLRLGDVLISVDGRPTREMAELVRVLSQLKVGDVVEVAYVRGRLRGVVRVELVPHVVREDGE
jgi:hypothetical protein